MTSVRVLISLTASLWWNLWQYDVRNSFLYGDLGKEIYMLQPLGFESNFHSDYVCILKKALYGFKQAPRAWYGKIAEYLHFFGYYASNSDPSLFVKKARKFAGGGSLYVDDMIVVGNDEKEICKLRTKLFNRFEMKDLGELSHFLGLEINYIQSGFFLS